MRFMQNNAWHCQFLETDLKMPAAPVEAKRVIQMAEAYEVIEAWR